MARVDRVARPSRLTRADRARQAAAVAAWDRRAASARRRERVARLLVWAIILSIGITLFYAATN